MHRKITLVLGESEMPSICSKCGVINAVYQRKYSGEYLCKKCFMHSIEEKVRKTISKFSMLHYDDKVAVAVSGGKDSLSLLHVLKKMIDNKKSKAELIAITVDEGIDGYRNESLQIVEDFCGSMEIRNEIISFKDSFGVGIDEAVSARPGKMSSCAICGTFRRRSLDMIAEKCGANVIATGHNLDDHIQTFLINLLGGDIPRIGWSHPEPIEYGETGIRKIKPFIELYEQEIVFYALQTDIPFQSEQCPYMHESIRSDIRNFFNKLEKEHPGIKYNAYNSFLKISEGIRSRTRPEFGQMKCIRCNRQSSDLICSVCKTMDFLDA
jgi:uncharacterized protein (TIGR00269 family)